MTEEVLSLIGNLGFPIFVAVFMLLRLETTVKDFTKSINDLTIELKKIIQS